MKNEADFRNSEETSHELVNMELEGLPPTVNTMYRGLRGHRYKTKACVEYQERVTASMRANYTGETYAGAVELRITFITSDRRRWDIDNRVKALQDCLIHAGIIKDDSQIEILHLERKHEARTATQIILKRL